MSTPQRVGGANAAAYTHAQAASFDQATAIATSTSTSGTLTTASVTPVESGELAVVASVNWHNSNVLTWNNGFVQETSLDGPGQVPPDLAFADQVLSTTSAIAGSATSTASNGWSMSMMLFKPATSSACTHEGTTSAGALAVPNGTSGSYWSTIGNFVTPNCSSVDYWQPTVGNSGVN